MPIIKSAKKKMRQDLERTKRNGGTIKLMKGKIKSALKSTSAITLNAAYKAIDTAVKKNVITKNKAARLKSRVAKTTTKNTATG